MSNNRRVDDVSERLRRLEDRVRVLEESVTSPGRSVGSAAGTPGIGPSDLPGSLSRSLEAMRQLGEADATAVSVKTARNRSVETIYLNQLVRLGILTRGRVGKKVFFRLARVY